MHGLDGVNLHNPVLRTQFCRATPSHTKIPVSYHIYIVPTLQVLDALGIFKVPGAVARVYHYILGTRC